MHINDELTRTVGEGLSRAQAYALVDAIAEVEELTLAVSAYELPSGHWAIEATCDHKPEIEKFSALARQILGGDLDFSIAPIDNQIDWVERSRDGLSPVLAGGFFIHGSHDADKVPTAAKPILIDAAQAFGTGHHQTTTGCLRAIDDLLRIRRPRYCIDVGTGTGVLAIAIAMRLKQRVIATDIDPLAVKTARENARKNGVGRWIRPFAAKGLDHVQIAHAAPFDLIVANILANPLIRMSPEMAELSARGGHIVLSGLLNRQAARVCAAYRATGFTLRRKYTQGDWATLVFQKR